MIDAADLLDGVSSLALVKFAIGAVNDLLVVPVVEKEGNRHHGPELIVCAVAFLYLANYGGLESPLDCLRAYSSESEDEVGAVNACPVAVDVVEVAPTVLNASVADDARKSRPSP